MSIRHTIQLGGDTDTNACIVGGMIGALVGITNIESKFVDTLLEFDCTDNSLSHQRPEYLSVMKYAVPYIHKLIEMRPINKLII